MRVVPSDKQESRASEPLKKILKSANLKVTHLRLAVLDYLVHIGVPVSHADIQAYIPDIDRVTLYRTLASFVETNIVHQVQGLDGAWRFCSHATDTDKTSCPGNHPHFLCTSCGKMTCLHGQPMSKIDVPDGYEVVGKQFVAYGLCPECIEKQP